MNGDRDPGRGVAPEPATPRLKLREIVSLILATYKSAFPYFLVIVLIMLIVTWFLTDVAFTR